MMVNALLNLPPGQSFMPCLTDPSMMVMSRRFAGLLTSPNENLCCFTIKPFYKKCNIWIRKHYPKYFNVPLMLILSLINAVTYGYFKITGQVLI